MPLMTSLVKAGRYKCIVVGQTIRDVTITTNNPSALSWLTWPYTPLPP